MTAEQRAAIFTTLCVADAAKPMSEPSGGWRKRYARDVQRLLNHVDALEDRLRRVLATDEAASVPRG